MTKLDPYGAFVELASQGMTAEHGPLAGVRLAVKDNIAVEGLKWTAGLPLLADRRAEEDASCVAALRAAGAVVVGVTATDAAGFGMMTPGVVNPLDKSRTAGGSSGGSAAAVAGGLADIALGTDTGGSVRVPAACCGLFGFKPSYGRAPTDGVTPLSTSFDHVGLIASNLELLTRAAAVLLDASEQPPPARSLVIGHDPRRMEDVDRAIAAAMRSIFQGLARAGHSLREVELPDRELLPDVHGLIVCQEARDLWSSHWPRDAELFGDTARRALAYANSVDAAEVTEARRSADGWKLTIADTLREVDVVIGPTLRGTPPRVGARRLPIGGEDVPVVRALLSETCPFNVSGHPALAMATPFRVGAIPVSIQLAAIDDMQLLALAKVVATVLAGRV